MVERGGPVCEGRIRIRHRASGLQKFVWNLKARNDWDKMKMLTDRMDLSDGKVAKMSEDEEDFEEVLKQNRQLSTKPNPKKRKHQG